MQSMTRIAVGSLAMLLIGSAAALAQPYGYGGYGPNNDQYYRRCYEQPYGPPECAQLRQRPDFDWFHYHAANVPGFIIDPATGTPTSQQEYESRYPWTSLATWTYDPLTNLWSDHTQQAGYSPQVQNYERDRDGGRGYEQDRDHHRDQDRDRDRR